MKVREPKRLHKAPLRVSTRDLFNNPVFAARREAHAGSHGPYLGTPTTQGKSIRDKLRELKAARTDKGNLLSKLEIGEVRDLLGVFMNNYLASSIVYAELTDYLTSKKPFLTPNIARQGYYEMRKMAETASQYGETFLQHALDYLKEKYPEKILPFERSYERRKKNAK
ncbi:hypothetical protein KA107_03315 [Candidatus Pacearchaeota archaeon]|nr:hypothetical protein [Candidatus Pacearchaeota archaeon]